MKIDKITRKKLGYQKDDNVFLGYCLLVKESKNVLHFNYHNSPKLELLAVEYMPKYSNGYVNTETNTYHAPTEQTGDGLLTFKNLNTNENFVIGVRMNRKTYIRLKTEFLTIKN